MRDRLAELQRKAAEYEAEMAAERAAALAPGVEGGVVNDIHIEFDEEEVAQPLTVQQQRMETFFTEVREIRQSIEEIKQNVSHLKDAYSEMMSAPQVDDEVKEELDQIMLEIQQKANKVRVVEKGLSDDSIVLSQADARIRKTQYNSMHRLLCDTLSEYNELQNQYREKCKATIKRQLEYTGKFTTDDELEEMIENGDTQVFTQGIFKDEQQARQMLQEVTSRHEEIKRLENSIKELFDVFVEMANLVEAQGEMIDRIEYNVNQIAEYVEEAVKETQQAKQIKNTIRKRKCCCWSLLAAVILIVIVIVIVVIVTTVCPNGCGGGGGGGGSNEQPSSTPTTTTTLESIIEQTTKETTIV